MTKGVVHDKNRAMHTSTVQFIKTAFTHTDSTAHQMDTNAESVDQPPSALWAEQHIRNTIQSNMTKPSFTEDPTSPPAKQRRIERPQSRLRKKKTEFKDAQNTKQIIWSPEQQRCIDFFSDYLRKVTIWRHTDRKQPPPDPPVIMILGGPGMGKSQLTRELSRLVEEHSLCSLSSADMVVAAGNMSNAGTISSIYNFAVGIGYPWP